MRPTVSQDTEYSQTGARRTKESLGNVGGGEDVQFNNVCDQVGLVEIDAAFPDVDQE